MKKLITLLSLLATTVFLLHGQSVSDYIYKLDNGINIKTEHTWKHVWISQKYDAMTVNDKTPLSVNIIQLGDLISERSFKLLSGGKEIKKQEATPGTYELKLLLKLSGKPGTLSFVVGNILIKPKTKTSVDVTLYDYQILISETPASSNGLASFETQVITYKSSVSQTLYSGIPSFYPKGKHDKAVSPDQATTKTSGSIKAGTYDLLVSIVISGQTHNIWLENFTMKPDIKYKITTNLNAGVISFTGVNKDVNEMKLYPAGTAATQTGNPSPNKSLEIISYDNLKVANCCSPGTYDVLLAIKNGAKYEWKKNVIVQSGKRAEVK